MRLLAILIAGFALAGCQTTNDIGSVLTGECQLVHSPQYAVRGRTNYDQIWVNRTTEAIVTGCKQPRPMKRPASLDAQPRSVAPTPLPPPKPKWQLRWPGSKTT